MAHTAIVTITYLNGTVLQATVLNHEEHEIRAIAAGCDDTLAFTRVHGTWIAEDLESVSLAFEWQGHRAAPVPAEDACVCPKELAALLIRSLFAGSAPQKAARDPRYVFNPAGIATVRTEFQLN
jgi:hypothetical protein